MGEYATQESEWKARALTAEAECGRLRERVEQLQTALADLTPSDDGGGYGPHNAAAWKDAYIDRLLETLDAERLAGRLREQLDAARQLVVAAKPGLSIPPVDCTNNCMDGPCDCSGKRRVTAWAVDVPALRAALGVEGPAG